MTTRRFLVLSLLLFGASAAWATPPGPGAPFDCSFGGDSSCASGDPGCVPGTPETLKCADGIATAIRKAFGAVIKCHKKQADDRFRGKPAGATGPAEDICQSGPNGGKSAKEKFDAAVAKVASLCDPFQLGAATAAGAVLFGSGAGSLDAANGDVYCDGTVPIDPSGDDSGGVPGICDDCKRRLSCADTVAGELGRLASRVIVCHRKMADAFFAGKEFAEDACDEVGTGKAALERFAAAMTKLDGKGSCDLPCMSRPSRDALGAAFLAQAESLVYPCPTTTTSSTTTTSTSTTVVTPTTTTTTSSTTTLPPCTNVGDPCGSCGVGTCLERCDGSGLVCGNAGVPNTFGCTSDAECAGITTTCVRGGAEACGDAMTGSSACVAPCP